MELTYYIRLLRKWLWLILLAAFVAGGVSYVVRSSQPPEYTASATVIIGNPVRNPDPNSGELRTAQDLTQTYAQILRTFDIRQAVVEQLGLSISADQLGRLVNTRILPGTSLLVIEVTFNDPVLTADIANELAEELIAASPTNLTEDQQSQIDVANTQITELSLELTELRQQLTNLDQDIENEQNISILDQLRQQRITLTDQINDTAANIAQFTNVITVLQQRTNSLELLETARIPQTTSGTSVPNAIFLGAMVGAVLAFGVVLVFEYLNDTVQTANEATHLLELPVLGVIARIGNNRNKVGYEGRLISDLPPLSHTSEQYNTLRANLAVAAAANSDENNVFIITSASPQEGKSVTATNLAISLALSGSRVLLIDADLRRPKIHEILGLPNEKGLSSLLSAKPLVETGENVNLFDHYDGIREFVQDTHIPGLRVITSGFLPKNPNEILGSVLMKRWAKSFRESPNIDFVIFDSPPTLAVSDSMVLVRATNAKVVFVLAAGATRRTVALRAKERFQHLDQSIVGLLINNANPQSEDYYGYDYSYYYTKTP